MRTRRKKVIVILGPTSSGKSEMAVQLAKKYNGEIISADSRQIFRDMNLGTGKVKGKWKDKLQIPSTKYQINSKYKITNSKLKNSPSFSLKSCEKNTNSKPSQSLFTKGEDKRNAKSPRPYFIKWEDENQPPLNPLLSKEGGGNENTEIYQTHPNPPSTSTADKLSKRGGENPLSPPLRKREENANAEIYQPHPSPPLSNGRGTNREVFVYEGIPHYLIDFVEPQDEYNVSHFKKDCEKLIKDINSRDKLPIICGGTGFWILSVVNDIDFPMVKPNKELRNKLRNKTVEELHEKLKEMDSRRAETIDAKNKQRLIRAIEIAKELGEVPDLNLFDGKNNEKFEFMQIGIDCSKEDLEEKIKKRLESRFLQGMIEEVKSLKEKNNLSWKKIQSFGLGYYWIPLFLQNKISEEKLKQKVFEAERGYAKRQKTWFNKQKGIEWVEELKGVERLVDDFLK